MQSAAIARNVEIVRLLVDHGADVGGRDAFAQTALHLAAYHGHEALISFSLKLRVQGNTSNRTKRYIHAINTIFPSRNGVDILARDHEGQMPYTGPLSVVIQPFSSGCLTVDCNWRCRTPKGAPFYLL